MCTDTTSTSAMVRRTVRGILILIARTPFALWTKSHASKCSFTFLGQVAVSGLGASLLVGPHHVSRGGVVNVLRSQTFGWHCENSLCSHRTAMSCPCLIAHAFRQRTASSEPSQQPFKAQKRRLRPVPPPPESQEWGTPTRTKCLTPPLLPEVLGASWVAAGDVQRF